MPDGKPTRRIVNHMESFTYPYETKKKEHSARRQQADCSHGVDGSYGDEYWICGGTMSSLGHRFDLVEQQKVSVSVNGSIHGTHHVHDRQTIAE